MEGGTTGFWPLALTGYIQWMMVNFCDLFFLDFWLIQRKAKSRYHGWGPKGTPLRVQRVDERLALPEHLPSGRFDVPHPGGAAQAGLGLLIDIFW